MQKYRIILPVIAIVLLVAWYAFRPERLFVNQRVHEELPTAQAANSTARLLASGKFHSVVHATSGTAAVYQLADGTRLLRFTDFKTSNGPDVHVYLVAADDATDNKSVMNAGFIDLGSIKGNIGDQNYTLGSDADLSKYRAVSVWCKRFSVNFGAAALSKDRVAQR
jgi:electron transfer DM13